MLSVGEGREAGAWDPVLASLNAIAWHLVPGPQGIFSLLRLYQRAWSRLAVDPELSRDPGGDTRDTYPKWGP